MFKTIVCIENLTEQMTETTVLIKYKERSQQQSRQYKWSSEIALPVLMEKRGHILETYSCCWRRRHRSLSQILIEKGITCGSANKHVFLHTSAYSFILFSSFCTVS